LTEYCVWVCHDKPSDNRDERSRIGAGCAVSLPYNPFDIIDTNTTEEIDIMTSEKKAEANRRNALKSTGPKTPEGKDAVRLNALKHGLLSQAVLLPGEDEKALRELGQSLRAELQPVGELESLLVDRIIASYWRLRRLGRVEAGIFAWELYGELERRAHEEVSSNTKPPIHEIKIVYDDDLRPPERIVPPEKDQETLSKAQEIEAKQIEAMQNAETPTLGLTFIRDASEANAFSKLSRYETAIERSLYKALHELQRLQAARLSAAVTPPQVLDVEVSGIPEETGH
jgi:hypothetical protein